MSTTGWLWAIVAVVIIGLGAWWFISQSSSPAPVPQQSAAAETGSSGTPNSPSNITQGGSDTGMQDNGVTTSNTSGAPMSATITYTAQGFQPSSVTIAKGGTVTWVDQVGGPMWVASNVHPTHTVYDGTSRTTHCAAGYSGPAPFDECGTGTSYSFTFDQTGSFSYHNHASAQFTGAVIVQ